MLRPFLLSLVLWGLGAGVAGAGDAPPEVAIWRWNVSVILDAQHAPSGGVGAVTAESFGQRHQRYSVLGLPESPDPAGPR
jgi:hypothetical protein